MLHQGRAVSTAEVATAQPYWVAAERVEDFLCSFPTAVFDRAIPECRRRAIPSRRCIARVGHRMDVAPRPRDRSATRDVLGLPASEIDKALLRMEATGADTARQVHRAAPRAQTARLHAEAEIEWCERRLLARIHRLTVAHSPKANRARHRRRSSCAGCLRWQHVAPGTQVQGERATMEVLRQLQGFEIPANAWERQVLARRIADYDPAVAGSTLPDWRRRLGTPVAASRHARETQPPASARDSYERRAHYILRARRSRLDDSA